MATNEEILLVNTQRQLEFALAEDRDPVAPGGQLTYTLTYGVLETSAGVPNGMLTMPVPAGTSFVSASDGGVLNGNDVEWTLGSLGAGMSGRREVTIQVDGGAVLGSIVAAIAEFANTSSPNELVRYEAATRVQSDLPVQLVVVASPNPVGSNETMDVELTVANNGPFLRTGVVLTLEIPDGLASLPDGLFDGDCPGTACEAQERATIVVGDLPSGAGHTFSIPFRVSSATLDGTVISLEVEASDAMGDTREASSSFSVCDARQLEFSLAEDRDPIAPGGQLTHTLTYGVLETSAGVPNGMLTFPVPAGTSFVSASDGGALNGNDVEWTLGGVNPGAGGNRTVVVQLTGGSVAGAIVQTRGSFNDSTQVNETVSSQVSTRVEQSNPLRVQSDAKPERPSCCSSRRCSRGAKPYPPAQLRALKIRAIRPPDRARRRAMMTMGMTEAAAIRLRNSMEHLLSSTHAGAVLYRWFLQILFSKVSTWSVRPKWSRATPRWHAFLCPTRFVKMTVGGHPVPAPLRCGCLRRLALTVKSSHHVPSNSRRSRTQSMLGNCFSICTPALFESSYVAQGGCLTVQTDANEILSDLGIDPDDFPLSDLTLDDLGLSTYVNPCPIGQTPLSRKGIFALVDEDEEFVCLATESVRACRDCAHSDGVWTGSTNLSYTIVAMGSLSGVSAKLFAESCDELVDTVDIRAGDRITVTQVTRFERRTVASPEELGFSDEIPEIPGLPGFPDIADLFDPDELFP